MSPHVEHMDISSPVATSAPHTPLSDDSHFMVTNIDQQHPSTNDIPTGLSDNSSSTKDFANAPAKDLNNIVVKDQQHNASSQTALSSKGASIVISTPYLNILQQNNNKSNNSKENEDEEHVSRRATRASCGARVRSGSSNSGTPAPEEDNTTKEVCLLLITFINNI